MEGTHRQLGARLSDRLGRDDADRFADGHGVDGRQVGAVALGADAVLGLAGQHRADPDAFHAVLVHQQVGFLVAHHRVAADHDLAGFGIDKVLRQVAAVQTLGERFDHFLAVLDVVDLDPLMGAAVVGADDDVLRHVHQPAGQVTRVGGAQRGVGQALAGAAGGNEVFQHVQAFAVVGADRHLNGAPGVLAIRPRMPAS